jgi:hypothetical protein
VLQEGRFYHEGVEAGLINKDGSVNRGAVEGDGFIGHLTVFLVKLHDKIRNMDSWKHLSEIDKLKHKINLLEIKITGPDPNYAVHPRIRYQLESSPIGSGLKRENAVLWSLLNASQLDHTERRSLLDELQALRQKNAALWGEVRQEDFKRGDESQMVYEELKRLRIENLSLRRRLQLSGQMKDDLLFES